MSQRSLLQAQAGDPRVRILSALLELLAERGFAHTTVRALCARAGISTATFYQHFENLEQCLTAVLDLGLERASELIAEAFADEPHWQDALRCALASLLVFLDSEPALTRAWFVDSLAAGRFALERRERNTRILLSLIAEPWQSPPRRPSPEAIMGVMASVFGLIHSHLISDEQGPLIELLGPTMGLIVSPFLDAEATAAEIERATELSRAIGAAEQSRFVPAPVLAPSRQGTSHDETRRAAMRTAGGRRALECLIYLSEHPGASNSELARALRITHKSQISRLLSELGRRELARKRSEGPGKRNRLSLTERGEEVIQSLTPRR